LVRALGRLSAKHREVLVLHFYVDMTDVEIAQALGVPVGTVKSRLSRARERLFADPTLHSAVEGGTQ
jgi:RNA polymerase sigma factor (sigma-70 family)